MENSSSPNPYDVLGVSQAASKAEIVKAVAVAMKLRRYPVDVIAKAQKSLMDSKKRLQADYLRPILPTVKRFKKQDLSVLATPAPRLHFLPHFDKLDAALALAAEEESLDTEPLTVDRDYFILLPNSPKYKAIEVGEVLPVSKSLTLKTIADGQCLFSFQLLALDSIQNRWLWLERFYPQGTELSMNLALDESGGDLQVTAALKNHPSVKISCLLTCGGVEEDILSQLGLITQKLDSARNRAEIFQIAGEVVFAVTQINRDGKPQAEKLEAAQTKLKKLESLFYLARYHQGMEHCRQKRYLEGIQYLEVFIQSCSDCQAKNYLESQMWLVKCYQAIGQLDKARALCQQLAANENPQIQTWARKVIPLLSPPNVVPPQKAAQSQTPPPKTLITALEAFKQKNYLEAVQLLEEFCQSCSNLGSKDYLQAQMTLVKAYHASGQLEKARTLCQQLTKHQNTQVANWALQALRHLSAANVNPRQSSESSQTNTSRNN